MFSKLQIIKLDQLLTNTLNDEEEHNYNEDLLFLRVSDEITSKKVTVEINDNYCAYIIKGGSDVRYYEKGPVEIFDNRSEVKDWKKGFSVDVIYMPKKPTFKVNWGTQAPFKYRDEASNKVVKVTANGILEEFEITNSMQFYGKIIGMRKKLTVGEFKKRFIEVINDDFVNVFLKTIKELKLTYDQFDEAKKEISERVWNVLGSYFENSFGCTFHRFIIRQVGISEDDENAIEESAAEKAKQKKMQEYLAELERLEDKQWEREKYLRNLELQDKAAYYEVLKVIGHPKGGDNGAKTAKPATVYCPHCGAVVKMGDIYCSLCGKRVVKQKKTCPHCGKINEEESVFCTNCGTKLN